MKGSAQTIPGLSHQVFVQIEIARGKIHCYPRRATDTLIYRLTKAGVPLNGRPLEVRWVVSGLKSGQYVKIAPKDSKDRTFGSRTPFLIESSPYTITSGRPSPGAVPGHCFLWRYSISLHDGGRVLDRLDPEVIIKDHP